MPEVRFQFDAFEFDAASGALHRLDASGEPTRLAPQPAALLALLARAKGELVTHEAIRAALWPETTVEYDAGVHFCIRQIRSALGDSAADARYIETLPRRGYRLIPPVITIGAPRENDDIDAPPPASRDEGTAVAAAPPQMRVLRRRAFLGAVCFGVVFIAAMLLRPDRPARIGIMPFVPDDQGAWPTAPAPIAEWILESLTTSFGDRAAIVGPTTTAALTSDAAPLRAVARELELDFMVNGRFVAEEDGAFMLAELIRTTDGAHVWVQRYDDLSAGAFIGRDIAANVWRELGPAGGAGDRVAPPESSVE